MFKNLKNFHSSILATVLGLGVGFGVGYVYTGTLDGALVSLFLTFGLAVLEVSLSFDNAIVNAAVLREMTPQWRHRFITWGMLIAVFGMRIVFPLAIVSVIGHLSPWDAVIMATTRPADYAEIMVSSHLALAGFGGSFLLLVCLRYFFDSNKSVHWISLIEKPLARLGDLEAIEMVFCLLVFYFLSRYLGSPEEQLTFLTAGIFGVATYVLVDGFASLCKVPEKNIRQAERASAALFVYLEILDASFSFDGVIGAFALTNNLFVIAAGLGIGAMFVRSLTIMLVEKNSLEQFPFVEHGAFYAIGALAVMMLLGVFMHIPEVITGLIGAGIIGISLIASVRKMRQTAKGA
jgi:hypothetical protein